MSERELDDLLCELRAELAVAPSPTFAVAVRQRIARASGVPVRAAVGVATALAALVLVALPMVKAGRAGLVIPDVPTAGRAVLVGSPAFASTSLMLPTRNSTSVATKETRASYGESFGPDPHLGAGQPSIAAISATVFRSDGVWVETPTPSWTESTYATVVAGTPPWTTVPESPVFDPVEFPTVEFTRAIVIPVTWPAVGEEHQR